MVDEEGFAGYMVKEDRLHGERRSLIQADGREILRVRLVRHNILNFC